MINRLKQLLVFGGITVVLYLGAQWLANRSLVVGAPPPIHAVTLDGTNLDIPSRQGRPAMIYFWASWCPICKAMQSSIEALARETPVISVALFSGDEKDVRAYIKQEGFDVPVILDPDGGIGRDYGLQGVPAIFILGPDGNIRFSTIGYTSELGLRVRLWLANFEWAGFE